MITVAPTPATVATTPCGHLYHAECIASSMLADRKYGRPPSCPMCRGPLHDFTLGDVERSNEAVVDREGVRVGAVGLGAYVPAFDAKHATLRLRGGQPRSPWHAQPAQQAPVR